MLTKKNAKASAVLAILYDRIDSDQWKDLSVEPYLNGRENGFCITNWNNGDFKKVCFSEDRNTDNIVVYTGGITDFQAGGNVPSDGAWKRVQSFGYTEYLKAAQYIQTFLFGT